MAANQVWTMKKIFLLAMKKRYSAFWQKEHFYMASISVDDDSRYWKMALKQETKKV